MPFEKTISQMDESGEKNRPGISPDLRSVVLEHIALGAPLKSVLEEIVDLVEDQFPDTVCTIHLTDPTRHTLRFAAGDRLPEEFSAAADTVPIGPGIGSCGTAAYWGKTVIVPDIATNPMWREINIIPLKYGLRSCWSVPILAAPGTQHSNKPATVLGTFAVYGRASAAPGPDSEALLATAVHLARVAVERESAVREIRESEARYAMISEITRSVTFGLRSTRENGVVIEWARPRFGLLSEYTEQEFRIHGWQVMFHPEDRDRVQLLFRDIAAGHPRREEFRYLTKSGDVLTVLLQGKLLEAGKHPDEALIIGGLLDVTELKTAEVALRASEERLRLALSGSRDGLWDWDIKSGRVFVSPRWKSILGYDDTDNIETFDDWVAMLHPTNHEVAYERIQEFLAGSSNNYETEFRMRHKSGQYRNILARGFVIRDVNGTPLRLVGTQQDITERKQADEELRASRGRLEALSRQLISTREDELRHLARELHDEIGQELTFMKMSLRDIQRTADEGLRQRLDENIGMIERILAQVRDLSLNLRPPHLDELGLVAALHWYLKRQAGVAGFQESVTVTPSAISVSPDLAIVCFRIVQEAVTNAVRHAKPKKVAIELWLVHDEFHLTIRDDGRGFDVAHARQRASAGTSLGLISMQERASLAHGSVEIKSAPGQGTTIHARFPHPKSSGHE